MRRCQGCLSTPLAAPLSLFYFLSFQIIQLLLNYKLPLTQQLKTMCSVLLGGYRPAGRSCWSGLVLAGLGWAQLVKCFSHSVVCLVVGGKGKLIWNGLRHILKVAVPLATGPHGPSFPSRPVVHMFQQNNWNWTGLGWELAKCPLYHILLTKVTKLFQFQGVGEKASFLMAENAKPLHQGQRDREIWRTGATFISRLLNNHVGFNGVDFCKIKLQTLFTLYL